MSLAALIEKLEKAQEGSRELDAAIWLATKQDFSETAYSRWGGMQPKGDPTTTRERFALERAPRFTASIDTALMLIPESLRYWWSIEWDEEPGGRAAKVFITPDNEAHGETPALALCAAALRARQHLAEQEVSA